MSDANFCVVLVSDFGVIKDIRDENIIQPLAHRVLAVANLGPFYQCARSGGGETATFSRRLAPN